MKEKEGCGTYETNTVSKNCVGRKGMQHFDDGLEPLEQFDIAFPELFKCLGLFLKYTEDRIGTITAIDHDGEWVIAEIIPSFPCVLRQGGVEECLKVGGSGDCIRSGGHGIVMGEMSDVESGKEGRWDDSRSETLAAQACVVIY